MADETISEMMIAMGSAPPPDELGNRTPVPSSDAQALIQELEAVLRDGTMDQVRSFLSNNRASLLTVASQDPDFANRLESIMGSMPRGGGGELLAPSGPMGPATPTTPVGTNEYDAWAGMGSSFPGPSFFPSEGQTAPDFEALEEVRGPMTEFAQGGYVGRGTMAGELDRRGDLSVREAGETMYERSKRLHGYDRGGYVHGRGTMPGELRRKGSLPVRVAGESMREYREHREDEDDVRPVRRTLSTALSPTLSRRLFS
jgi:hypothetical protein